jgi:hypothetical protein
MSLAPLKCKIFASHFAKSSLDGRPCSKKRVAKLWKLSIVQTGNETSAHIIFKCGYSFRIWNFIIHWLGLASMVDVSTWANHDMVKEWWMSFISPNGCRRSDLLLSSCLLLGRFRTSTTLGFSVMSPPCLPLLLLELRVRRFFGTWQVPSIWV